MVLAKSKVVHMRHGWQMKISNWVSTSIMGVLLSTPAFAQTDSERISELEKQVSQLTTGMATRSNSGDGLPLHGFLDIGYASNNYEDVAAKLHGFNVGSLDFYLTPQFSDNVKSLVELVFEVDAQGAVSADFERAQVGYILNDKMTLWGGRFHTPYGYWNTAFHNGAQIQTSILRPRFLAFGDKGGVLPAHMVGLWAAGKTGAGEGKSPTTPSRATARNLSTLPVPAQLPWTRIWPGTTTTAPWLDLMSATNFPASWMA